MIVFELTMPNRGSWNNKWSGDDLRFIRARYDRDVPRKLWGNDYCYRWNDGWCACVSVTHMDSKAARKLERNSAGFCGYDWMIKSLIQNGEIKKED